jgi:hypothetical protein
LEHNTKYVEVLLMDIVEDVRTKLEEYGIGIYTDYPLNKEEYLFMVDNMLLFIHTENHEIGISFQAETRPKTVANCLLIILEIDSVSDVDIMESCIVDENKNFISGEKAFKIIDAKNQNQALGEIFKDQEYTEILANQTSGEC